MAEIFPQHVRDKAVTISVAVGNMRGVVVAAASFPLLKMLVLALFLIVAGINFIGAMWEQIELLEMKQNNFQDIDSMFMKRTYKNKEFTSNTVKLHKVDT